MQLKMILCGNGVLAKNNEILWLQLTSVASIFVYSGKKSEYNKYTKPEYVKITQVTS